MFGLNGRRFVILMILGAMFFVGAQYIPPYIDFLQFRDYVRQQVKYAGTSRRPPEAIRADVVMKAEELEIPVTKKDIKISKQGPSFTLEFEYQVHIDLKVYQQDITFPISETGETFENASD